MPDLPTAAEMHEAARAVDRGDAMVAGAHEAAQRDGAFTAAVWRAVGTFIVRTVEAIPASAYAAIGQALAGAVAGALAGKAEERRP